MFTATSSAISLHSINVSLHLVRLGSIKTCYWPGPDCRPVSGGLRRHSAGEDRSAVPNRTMPNFGARHSPPGTIVLFENSLRGVRGMLQWELTVQNDLCHRRKNYGSWLWMTNPSS